MITDTFRVQQHKIEIVLTVTDRGKSEDDRWWMEDICWQLWMEMGKTSSTVQVEDNIQKLTIQPWLLPLIGSDKLHS